MQEEYCKLLNVSRNTYYVHKRENRPIVSLIEKYFTEDDLEEFLETGKISKLENTSSYTNKVHQLDNFIMDDAKYSAKVKYLQIFSPAPEIETVMFQKVIDSINDEDYNINNAKEILIDRLKGFVVNIKEKRVPKYHAEKLIEDYFSNLEIYAMLKLKNDLWNNKPIK